MSSTMVNFRTETNIKATAFEVFKSYGLSPSQAMNLFLAQVANTRTIPLSLNYQANQPNQETIKALQSAQRGEVEHFNNLDELHRALGVDVS